MTASGFGAADRVKKSGDAMTGTLTLGGTPPITLPAGTSGYVLTSDGSGNITLAPAAGGGGGVTLTPVLKTSAYTANPAELVVCDATSASFTVTLPAAPADKSVVAVKMTVTASSHTVTVTCGGSDVLNVAAGATTLTLPLLFQGVILQYKSSSAIWYVTGDDLPLSQLDARYVQVGGDLGGTTASPTVAKIQGTAISSPPGGSTQFLRGDGTWQVPAGGGGGGMTNPMTTLGDLIFENATPAAARLAGSTSATRMFLRQTGTGSVSAAPAWDTLTTGDLPAGVALLAGAAFTGNVSTTGTLKASRAVVGGVVTLTDAATIAVDASLGNTFRVTLGGNRTLGTPSNPTDGQLIRFEVTQDATGSRTLAYSGAYAVGSTVPFPTLTTTASKTDILGFAYYATGAVWRLLAVAQNF